ncbi:MAG: alpha-1,2-fucosyltransferase [Bacteroidota bacterium]
MVRLMGGMGNQMFQYSFGKYLAKKNRTPFKLDPSLLLSDDGDPNKVMRDYSLDIFQIRAELASKKEIDQFNPPSEQKIHKKAWRKLRALTNRNNLVIQKHHEFLPEHLDLSDDTCIVGNWQSERYFSEVRDQVREDFEIVEKLTDFDQALAENIRNSTSICLNVRRADYVTHPEYSKKLGAIPIEYYDKAIAYFQEEVDNPEIFVFSDDIESEAEEVSRPAVRDRRNLAAADRDAAVTDPAPPPLPELPGPQLTPAPPPETAPKASRTVAEFFKL